MMNIGFLAWGAAMFIIGWMLMRSGKEDMHARQRTAAWHRLRLGQKTVASRLLLLAGVFRLRKAPLTLHRSTLRPTDRQSLSHTDPQPGYFFGASLAGVRRSNPRES